MWDLHPACGVAWPCSPPCHTQKTEPDVLPESPLGLSAGCTWMLGGSRKRQVCFSRESSSGRAKTLRKQMERSRDFLSTSMGGLSALLGR